MLHRMSTARSSLAREKAYSYTVITPPAQQPLLLADVKDYLRITSTSSDVLLTQLIDTATFLGQRWSDRIFINTEFRTLRDNFDFAAFQLRRNPFNQLNAFEYLDDTNNLVTIDPATYYVNIENDGYSSINLLNGESWPDNISDNRDLQRIRIDFQAGFGSDETSVPSDIKTALMAHIAALYENRGDCACTGNDANMLLPAQSRSIYRQYAIPEFRVGF